MQRNQWLPLIFGCHQKPERSFKCKGKVLPICARCTGELIGFLMFTPLFLWIKPSFFIGFLLLMPMIVDGLIQAKTQYESHNMTRLFTGILGGVGLLTVVVNVLIFGYQLGFNLTST
jgi:uncharacterized membrane protein